MFEIIGNYIGVGAETVAIACAAAGGTYLALAGPLHWLGLYSPQMTCGQYNEKATAQAALVGISKPLWMPVTVSTGVIGALVTIGYTVEVLL
jgi:hypothetical protein